MKHRLVAPALLAAALMGTGCGKSSSSHKLASATTTTAADLGGDASTSTTAKGGGTATTLKGGTTTTAKGATTTTTRTLGPSTTTTTVPVTANVDHGCVHPGDDQGLTVHGPPGDGVIYDTVYSDGSDELTNHYGSGFGKGTSDDRGVYRATWKLALTVPAGPATINIAAANGSTISRTKTTFLIKRLGEPC